MKKNEKEMHKLQSFSFVQLLMKWVGIPFCLLLLWLVLSLIYSSYRSFTVLEYAHYQNSSNKFFDKQLLQGQKLSGDFYAKENNLGIIAIRLGDIPHVGYDDQDILLFRIKEKGSSHWLYTNTYRSGSLYPNDFHPFGFVTIPNSKNKEYIFELISTRGVPGNAIITKHTNPIYLSKYKFTKHEVLGNVTSLTGFIKDKVISFISNSDQLLSSSFFLVPFVVYIVWFLLLANSTSWLINSSKKQINKNRILIGVVALFICFDIIFFEFINVGFMLGLLGLWISLIVSKKLSSRGTLMLAFLCLLISLVSIYFHLRISFDKASAFGYFLLVIGLVQSIVENKQLIRQRG